MLNALPAAFFLPPVQAGETVAGAATGVAHAASYGASAFADMAQESFAVTKDTAVHVASATAGAAQKVAGAAKDMAQDMVGTTAGAGITSVAGGPVVSMQAAADADQAAADDKTV
jgi:hypothetical protein